VAQAFHLGLETVFFAGQEMALDTFCLCAVLAIACVVFATLPGIELLFF